MASISLSDHDAADEAAIDGWGDFHKRFAALGLPQVPDTAVAGRFAELIAGHDDHVLLLGITRILAKLGSELTAVDWCAKQIERLWPGDGLDRRAALADWRDMALPLGHFTAAVGDGCFSALTWPDDYSRMLERVAASLTPGGRLVVRCFVAPDEPESLEQIAQDVQAGREPSFHAARWRVAMAAADRNGNVVVGDIHDAFRSTFPDWPVVAEQSGWDLAAIELIMGSFKDSPLVYSFVTCDRLVDALGGLLENPRFESSGDYPLAERCPFLVAERPG